MANIVDSAEKALLYQEGFIQGLKKSPDWLFALPSEEGIYSAQLLCCSFLYGQKNEFTQHRHAARFFYGQKKEFTLHSWYAARFFMLRTTNFLRTVDILLVSLWTEEGINSAQLICCSFRYGQKN